MAHSFNSSPILVVVGPTASGKTRLAMRIAKKLSGEIICADSQTIYRGFDIGTAKPTREQQEQIPHFGLDLVEPAQPYSVYDFKNYALSTIAQIKKRHHVPILVGGSGLYIDSILFDYKFRTHDTSEELAGLTLDELQSLAKMKYPKQYTQIENQNRLRLEQFISRGPASKRDLSELKIPAIIIGLNPGMPIIKQNIVSRIDEMVNNGFVQEVENLMVQYGPDSSIIDSTGIGYKYIKHYILGKISLETAKEKFARDDLALAKRQVTWFKPNPHIIWFEDGNPAYRYAIKAYSDRLQ